MRRYLLLAGHATSQLWVFATAATAAADATGFESDCGRLQRYNVTITRAAENLNYFEFHCRRPSGLLRSP